MKFDIPSKDKNKGGVYMLVSTKTSDTYIGATVCFYKRYLQHKTKQSTSEDSLLGIYKQKYGIKSLIMRCLVVCDPADKQRKEAEMISKYRPSLNMMNGASASIRKNKNSIRSLESEDYTIDIIYPPRIEDTITVAQFDFETIGSLRKKRQAS